MPSPHNTDTLTDYLFGDLTADQAKVLEKHLKTCAPCSDFVAAAMAFHDGLRAASTQSRIPEGEVCPDLSLIVALTEETLDERTAKHVRAHVLHCKDCMEEFRALERMRPKLVKLELRAAPNVVHCLRPPEEADCQTLSGMAIKGQLVPGLSYPFRVTELLTDATGATSTVSFRVENRQQFGEIPEIAIVIDCDKPVQWTISVSDTDGRTMTKRALRKSETLFPLRYGLYDVEISKDEDLLGRFSFTIEPFSFEEAIEAATESLEMLPFDSDRVRLIFDDAAKRYPQSRDALSGLFSALNQQTSEEVAREVKPLWDVLNLRFRLRDLRKSPTGSADLSARLEEIVREITTRAEKKDLDRPPAGDQRKNKS